MIINLVLRLGVLAELLFIVLVGKKNLEVRPVAVNKGEIVKRILYLNPDAQFVFCAGDDKVRFSHQTNQTFSSLFSRSRLG